MRTPLRVRIPRFARARDADVADFNACQQAGRDPSIVEPVDVASFGGGGQKVRLCCMRSAGCDESDQRNQGEAYHRCTLGEPTSRHIGTFAFAS
jgi:hypothetical protein